MLLSTNIAEAFCNIYKKKIHIKILLLVLVSFNIGNNNDIDACFL